MSSAPLTLLDSFVRSFVFTSIVKSVDLKIWR